jgi:hypothetical protein
MKLESFFYDRSRGWSVPRFPDLDSESTLVLAFGCPGDDAGSTSLAELSAAYPRAHLLGCSTAGEILDQSIHDGRIVVAVCQLEASRLRSTAVPIGSSTASNEAGRAIASQLGSPDLRGILVLSDGLQVNGSELVLGLNATLPSHTVVTGGLAGDGDRFQRTWVLRNRTPESGWISAVGLYGDRLTIGHGSKGGWVVFGPERVVTRSKGNVLFEIDGKSALGLYKLYLGELASGLPANALLFPLGLRRERTSEVKLVRTILSIDEQAGSMTFAGDIPEGSWVQFMRSNLDQLVDGAGEAARLAASQVASQVLAIAISCVGRRLVLGDRAEDEIEIVRDSLPPQSHVVGFYSYGEISPYASGPCELHNQTMTLTTISES